MSTESLYTIISITSEQDSHRFCVKLNPDHSVYAGHFPNQPVLPGVCSLQIIRECAALVLKRNIRYLTIAQCKFTSMIVPSEKMVDISIRLGNGDSLKATVEVDGTTMLKLKSTFTEV